MAEPQSHHSTMQYDFIVVGAGSAGCVVANRLVRDHGARVLLLEQGPADDSPLIRMPAGSFKMLFGNSPFVKHYASAPQPRMSGRTVPLPQGNVLGGGSSINVMNYARGSELDYSKWDEATGGAGWKWADLLPYFRRQEGNQRLDNASHGSDGPLKVSDARYKVEAADLFVRTMQRMGLPYRHDFNDGELHGVGYIQLTMQNACRCSAADAFLHPLSGDPRLDLRTGARVSKIRLENGRAVGVEFRQNGQHHVASAAKEVILTAGALVTPKLLMLSGIGPADELAAHGIKCLVNLPGVGKGLQDHNTAVAVYAADQGQGYFGEDRGLRMLRNGMRYMMFKDGPVASNGAETMGFVNLNNPKSDPDIQLYCVAVRWPSSGAAPGYGISLIANLVKPLSRGSVTLRSSDPDDDPIIDLNWLAAPSDEARLVAGLRYLREIAATAPLKNVLAEELVPGPAVRSDREIGAYIARTTESNYHPVGTCAMGLPGNAASVLDPQLRVIGVEGLRVMDASMMPQIISANTNATVMAVADRGVDLMMKETSSAFVASG